MSAPNDLIIFGYPASPYFRRVISYLTLRGIHYAQCTQPNTLPRPDLEALNVSYRRIPLLSIGRDVYADTRLILRKLESRFPDGKLGATAAPEHRALERLLERFTVDAGVFARAAALIPPDYPLMRDPRFLEDRAAFTGRSWEREVIERGRPEAVVHVRDAFALVEGTLLADGRAWVLGTEGPSLADIEAIWPFEWLVGMKGALPPSVISEKQFPKVYAWIKRFGAALKAAKAKGPKPVMLKGEDAVKHILDAEFAEPEGRVDENDPLGFKAGEEVEAWPIDSGSSHHDRGRLVTLTAEEVTVAKTSKVGGKEIRVHMPRWGFRITKANAAKL